jgi:hypothetical protein
LAKSNCVTAFVKLTVMRSEGVTVYLTAREPWEDPEVWKMLADGGFRSGSFNSCIELLVTKRNLLKAGFFLHLRWRRCLRCHWKNPLVING